MHKNTVYHQISHLKQRSKNERWLLFSAATFLLVIGIVVGMITVNRINKNDSNDLSSNVTTSAVPPLNETQTKTTSSDDGTTPLHTFPENPSN